MKECKCIILLLFLSIWYSNTIQAQDIPDPKKLKANQLKAYSKSAVELGDTYTAIDYLDRYCHLKPKDLAAAYELAKLYHKAKNYGEAQDWYHKVYEADKSKYIEGLFYYALMLKANSHYKEAEGFFVEFKKKYRGSDVNLKRRVKTEINGCKLAYDIIDEESAELKVRIAHLDSSINNPHMEYAPAFMDDETMVYSSLKANSLPHYKKGEGPKSQFYIANQYGNNWEGNQPFKLPNLDNKFNYSNASFSPDASLFYFTQCEKKAGKMHCSIYVSKRDNKGNWSEPKLIEGGVNDPKYTATQPNIAVSNKKGRTLLYFVSDRPGGKGGLDIWYSIYNKKTEAFSEPKNLGSKVNTIGDEITPYYHQAKNTLYFSSNGWPNIGGFDIYKTVGAERKWRAPSNIGHPVNSNFDDLSYVLNPFNYDAGFFVSNRSGGQSLRGENCCDDIYSFEWQDYLNVTVHGKLYDVDFIEKVLEMDNDAEEKEEMIMDQSRLLIKDQPVKVYEIAGADEPTLLETITTNDQGEYTLEIEKDKRYKVVIERKGYFNKHHEFLVKDPLVKNINQHLGLHILTKAPIIVKNIYYRYNEATLTDEAIATLDTTLFTILQENPNIIVEIDAHTDNHGTHDFNMKLSQDRAQSVVDHLIVDGISKKRLKAKGYGETQPIAPNTYSDGTDNPEGRAKNRRTEFRVVGTLDGDNPIIYEE